METKLIASHYGVIKFGDLECEAVVLENGERGYVRKHLSKMFGFTGTGEGPRYRRFLAEFSSKRTESLDKKGSPILLPSGQTGDGFGNG